MRAVCAFFFVALLGSGCGSIAYDDAPPRSEEPIATAGGSAGYYVPFQPQAQPYGYGPYVTVVPGRPAPPPMFVAPPPPPRFVAPPPPMLVQAAAPITCAGNDRVRIHDEVVDGGQGPAVHASGNCVVVLSDSLVRGQPAVVVAGNARVVLVECRIEGDLRSHGNARIGVRRSAHRGRALHL